LTVVAGLRYDWYDSDDSPRVNPNFTARYGHDNGANFDGLDLLQPRLGFTWQVDDRLSVHGGAGLYSGGNPNVWLSNNYSNNGITQVEVQDRTLDDAGNPDTLFTIAHNGAGRPIYDIPQALFDAVGSGTTDSAVNSLDPDFKVPSAWKYNLGLIWNFTMPGDNSGDYVLTADYLYSDSQDSAIIVDKTLERIGSAPDGRPIYRGIDRSDPDCVVPTAATCSGRSQDFELTNVSGGDGYQSALSLGLSKSWDNGISMALGYAYVEAEDVNPMTSSVAFSNYANIAVSDPNNPGAATSNYEIPHRFTLRLQYEAALWGDNMTRISLFGSRNEGRPFTYTFTSGSMFGDSVGFVDRALLYVPTGPNDPNVTFAPGFDTAAFFQFADSADLSAGIAERNYRHSNWWTKFDLKVEQELPGFFTDDKFSVFVVIENLGNLLNDDWGILREASFPRYQSVVDASIDAGTGKYVFNEFFEPSSQSRATDASLWEMRLGVRYVF
ncbi:MAG: hypothetical protein KDI36_15115, partial [Pseudomonadales bacterium]|nr:hypothetical protein [Pseudomonadales bacterium]